MRFVKASEFKWEPRKTYYAKWPSGTVIKCTGSFQESDGTFFWDVRGYIPILKKEHEMLLILDETEQDEGWVPVSDRLPEINQKVLILENDDMYTSFWDGTYSKDKRKMPQFPDGQDEQPGYYWPSHWRPLPAPPATT